MAPRIVDVDLENFHHIPAEGRATVFWELDREDSAVDPRFQKEEWFSSTLLEWGTCGKLMLDMEASVEDAENGLGFAQFAPPTLFPRRLSFASGEASSLEDAVFLSYCYVVDGHRGRGLGTALVRDVARAAVDRGYRAVEAIGDRSFEGGWVLPAPFLATNGFRVVRDDERYPLLRLDLREVSAPLVEHATADHGLEKSLDEALSVPPPSGVG
jgi:GNAT superfamily N-acetyltransferase